MSSGELLESTPEVLAATDVRARLELLATLGYGLLESGQTAGPTERVLVSTGRSLGLESLTVNLFGRMLLLASTLPDGNTVSVSGAARTLDAIDCTRSHSLNRLAAEFAAPRAPGSREVERQRLTGAREAMQKIRDTRTPRWATTVGMTMLAFCISMQVGITWRAWVSAAAVEVVTLLVGWGVNSLRMPKLFATAVQSSAGGAFATLLVQCGFVDPVGAAAAIAVTWLLLLPLPQVIGAVTDAIEADYLSSLSRIAMIAVAGIGIFIGGAFTFALGEMLHMAHPKLDELPDLAWYLVLPFSMLGAIANAFANGGRLPLVVPAATLGIITSATDQALIHLLNAPVLWANSASAVVLGILTVSIAARTGYPQPVLALMGITGALLPGISVFFGILQQMGGASGAAYFGHAAAICIGIGTGVAFGVYLAGLWNRSPL